MGHPDERARLERGLERLGELREALALRINQLQAAQHRIGELTAAGIDHLDELDGDPDLEPTLGTIGSTFQTNFDQRHAYHVGDVDEREEVSEGEGDWDEREPDFV